MYPQGFVCMSSKEDGLVMMMFSGFVKEDNDLHRDALSVLLKMTLDMTSLCPIIVK